MTCAMDGDIRRGLAGREYSDDQTWKKCYPVLVGHDERAQLDRFREMGRGCENTFRGMRQEGA